jgi:3-hydroxyacyl-CoA dehydrogenase
MVLFAAQEEEWDELEFMVKKFQDTFMKVKYLAQARGGGSPSDGPGRRLRVCLARGPGGGRRPRPTSGLVEVGVGVIPAGGGCKELLIRNTDYERVFKIPKGGLYPKQVYLLPFMARAFETIAMAKVATSAKEAIKMGIFRNTDKVVPERRLPHQDGQGQWCWP